MKIIRKVLMFGRHAEVDYKSQPDNRVNPPIVAGSIKRIYSNQGSLVKRLLPKESLKPKHIYVRHSNAPRTKYTARAILAGSLDMLPIPETMGDLDALDFGGIEFNEDPNLNFSDLVLNYELMKKEGYDANLKRWHSDPFATEHEGVTISPLAKIVESRGRYLAQELSDILKGNSLLGVLATHGGIMDGLMAAAISSGDPLKSAQEISIMSPYFYPEQNAYVIIDQSEKSGSFSAELISEDRKYPINVGNLISLNWINNWMKDWRE